MLLKNKVAVVTGANRGLGKAITRKLAEEGAVVALVGRNKESLMKVVNEIKTLSNESDCFIADVTKEKEVIKMSNDVIQRYGRIDILVNNAGISKEMNLEDMDMSIWREIIETNLNSVALVIKAFLPYMRRNRGGNIINIGSGAALRGLPGSIAYSASKAGVVCLSQALGDELKHDAIRVNVICPGPIDTELFKKSERREFLLKNGSDIFSPETVANGVLYLASDLSSGVNSQILTIRGTNRW